MNKNREHIKRIKSKLKLAKKKGLSCFGSDKHKFKLNPPIKESELLKFEREQGITLPDDYRDFLLYAGNGGAGPYYGIYKLENWKSFTSWVIDNVPDDILQRPSRLHPGSNEIPIFSEDDNIYDQQHIDFYQGTISIGTQGCTYETLLVVSGDYRGRIVYVDADDNPPYMSREVDFLSWYERWLDELLNGYNLQGGFGFGPGGGAEDFFRIIDTAKDKNEIEEAFYAFGRLPELKKDIIDRILSYKTDDRDYVKAAVCWLIWKFELPCNDSYIWECLSSESESLRNNAILVTQRNIKLFKDRLLIMAVMDNSRNVAERAYFKVKEELLREDYLKLLSSHHNSIRYYAADNSLWTEQDIDLLITLLKDTHPMVRASAVSGLDLLKARQAIPYLIELLMAERNKKDEERVYDDCYAVDRAMKFMGECGDIASVPELMEWVRHKDDDMYRLHALEALAMIGEERIVPVALDMLKEDKKPERYNITKSYVSVSNIHPIKKLVRDILNKSPNPKVTNIGR